MKNIVRAILLILVVILAGPTACTIRIVDHGPQSQNSGYGQQPRQGGWLKTDLEVGRDHHKGDTSIEVGSDELTREEKISLQEILVQKAKAYRDQNRKSPTKEMVLGWGREIETRPFDVRLTDKETGEPVYEPYTTPKVVRQAWVPAEKVPESIRKQYRVLPPTYGGR